MTFGRTILATTALVLCVTAAPAGQRVDRPSDRIVPKFMKFGTPARVINGYPVTIITGEPRPITILVPVAPKYRNAIFDNINWHDKNAEWLTWYGFTTVASSFSSWFSSNSHFRFRETGFNALPFYGKGTKAKKIGAAVGVGGSELVNLGIYSATASGLPGNEIAGASTLPNTSGDWPVTWVKVNIKLKAGQEYFLGVACGAADTHCYGAWYAEDTNFLTAEDYWHVTERETYNFGTGTHTFSFSSPWHESSYYPEQGAAIVK